VTEPTYDAEWTGLAEDSQWDTPGNWLNSHLPAEGDLVLFPPNDWDWQQYQPGPNYIVPCRSLPATPVELGGLTAHGTLIVWDDSGEVAFSVAGDAVIRASALVSRAEVLGDVDVDTRQPDEGSQRSGGLIACVVRGDLNYAAPVNLESNDCDGIEACDIHGKAVLDGGWMMASRFRGDARITRCLLFLGQPRFDGRLFLGGCSSGAWFVLYGPTVVADPAGGFMGYYPEFELNAGAGITLLGDWSNLLSAGIYVNAGFDGAIRFALSQPRWGGVMDEYGNAGAYLVFTDGVARPIEVFTPLDLSEVIVAGLWGGEGYEPTEDPVPVRIKRAGATVTTSLVGPSAMALDASGAYGKSGGSLSALAGVTP